MGHDEALAEDVGAFEMQQAGVVTAVAQRTDGSRVDLAGTGRVEMGAGDVFVIETPGGGGFGEAGVKREAAE